MVRASLMLMLGLLVVAEQLLVLRLTTAATATVIEQSTSPEQGDPGFIGRAEASTRSVPRPCGIDGLPVAPRGFETARFAPAIAARAPSASAEARRAPLNRRI